MARCWSVLDERQLQLETIGSNSNIGSPLLLLVVVVVVVVVLCSCAACPTGNGEKLNCRQAESGQAINSAVAKFPSISCGASCARAQ